MVLSALCVFSCSGQQPPDTITLHITNRSDNLIDSVVIGYKQIKMIAIKPGEKQTLKIDVSQFPSQHEGVIPVYVYKNERKFAAQFGFHDWGVFPKKEESLYVFDKGINNKDELVTKPLHLILYVIPKTSTAIDSIEISSLILKKKTKQPTFTELLLDFSLFEKEPEIKVHQKGKVYTLKIDHDWNNWNYNQELIYIYDNGIISKKEM